MQKNIQRLLAALFSFSVLLTSCNTKNVNTEKQKSKTVTNPGTASPRDTIYSTTSLKIVKLSPHSYQHISFLQTNDFGKVSCNGMLVVNGNEAVVLDTPTDSAGAAELIRYVTDSLKAKIKAVIPTHFHNDCLGGMAAFVNHKIPAYASAKTIAILDSLGNKVDEIFKPFRDSLVLAVGNEKIYINYFGEGHTKDNVTAWFPEDKVLFGGCLVKELDASKGFLGDANVPAWPGTVLKVKQQYPEVKIVVPGHGLAGNSSLLDYTIRLFEEK